MGQDANRLWQAIPRAQHENGRPDTHRISQGKLHPNSRWQGMIAQQGAIGALEILDLDHPTFHIQAAVVTRSQGIFDPDVSLSAAADLQNPLVRQSNRPKSFGTDDHQKKPVLAAFRCGETDGGQNPAGTGSTILVVASRHGRLLGRPNGQNAVRLAPATVPTLRPGHQLRFRSMPPLVLRSRWALRRRTGQIHCDGLLV